MKQKLSEKVKVTVPSLSILMISQKKHAFFDVIGKIGQNQSFWAITVSFFRFHQNFIRSTMGNDFEF